MAVAAQSAGRNGGYQADVQAAASQGEAPAPPRFDTLNTVAPQVMVRGIASQNSSTHSTPRPSVAPELLAQPTEDSPIIFDGDESTCSLCVTAFVHGVRVVRLRCRHMFHSSCWQSQQTSSYRATQDTPSQYEPCANCRGEGSVVAMWNFIDPERQMQPGAVSLMADFHEQTEALRREHEATTQDEADNSPQEYNISTPEEREVREPSPVVLPSARQILTDQLRSYNPFHRSNGPVDNSSEVLRSLGEGLLRAEGHQAASNRRPSSAPSRRPRSISDPPGDPQSFPTFPSTLEDYWSWDESQTNDRFQGNAPVRKEGADATQSFHTETRLRDGRPSILVDPGSLGNLAGDQWSNEAAAQCLAQGGPNRIPSEHLRNRPLTVSGVGSGSQSATHNVRIPYACKTMGGKPFAQGHFEAPCVPNSNLPALLGLTAMKKQRTILDLVSNQMHFCGPGDIKLLLPEGTESFQLEEAPSGHLMLPISEYQEADKHEDNGDMEPKKRKVLLSTSTSTAVTQSSPAAGSSDSI